MSQIIFHLGQIIVNHLPTEDYHLKTFISLLVVLIIEKLISFFKNNKFNKNSKNNILKYECVKNCRNKYKYSTIYGQILKY